MDLQAINRSGASNDAASALSHGQIRRRAIIACRHCSMRKVRCNVASSGLPCGNCLRDEIMCEVVPRRKRRGRQRVVNSNATLNSSLQESSGSAHNTQDAVPVAQIVNHPSCGVSENDASTASSLPSELLNPANRALNAGTSLDEGENKEAYVQALDASPRSPEEELSSLFYCGGGQGLNGFMFDWNNGKDVRRGTHYLLPRPNASEMPPPQEAFLESIGAYQLPAEHVCNALLRCYFRNVHQLLPIIDAQKFLQEFLESGRANISLLLLWSIFFASANFVDSSVLQNAGFASRKAMKRKFYNNAKVLYDFDYEKDKIIIIQSLILMSLWYIDAEDRTGAWHWIGIAISLSQSIGLHRRLRLVNSYYPIPRRRESIYRRIWWSCFVRDRWLSLAKGRPMRINTADCDVEEPSVSDVAEELESMDPAIRSEYIPYEPSALAHLWMRLLEISIALGSILQTHYKVGGPRPGVADVQKCEEELSSCYQNFDTFGQPDPMMRLFILQLQLFYEATVVVLYRLYITKGPAHSDEAVEEYWKTRSLEKTRAAAANTSRILEILVEMDLVKSMKSMALVAPFHLAVVDQKSNRISITSLIPAMQIHLLDCQSSNALTRRFAGQKIDICMLVISQLRSTYWGADFMFRLFQRAQAKVAEKLENSLQSSYRSSLVKDQDGTPAPELRTFESPSEFLCNPCAFQSPRSGSNLLTTAEPMSNLSNVYFGEDTSLDEMNDASVQWLLGREDFTGLFLDLH